MSETAEMETITDYCKLSEPEETTRSIYQAQDETGLDTEGAHVAAQDGGSKKQTEVDCDNAQANVELQDAGRISSRDHKIILLIGSFILIVMFGMALFILLRLLKQV